MEKAHTLAGIKVVQKSNGHDPLTIDYPCHPCTFKLGGAACKPAAQVEAGFAPCHGGFYFVAATE